MAQALVSAKTQSVKDIKKKSFIKKRNKLFIKIALILIVLVLIALILNRLVVENRYSFTDKQTGIKYKSENFHLKEAFEIFSQDQNYLVVFNYMHDDSTYLSSILDSISFVQSILFAKNKEVTLVISTLDSQRQLVSCQTNYGNIYENITINYQECVDLVDSNYSVIFVDYPYAEIENSKVTLNLSQKLLYIKPNKKEDVYFSLRGSLVQMFKDFVIIEKNISDVQDLFNDENFSIQDDQNKDQNKNLDILEDLVIDDNFSQDLNISN